MHNYWAGTLIEDEEGFHYSYRQDYLQLANPQPISLTLPLTSKSY